MDGEEVKPVRWKTRSKGEGLASKDRLEPRFLGRMFKMPIGSSTMRTNVSAVFAASFSWPSI